MRKQLSWIAAAVVLTLATVALNPARAEEKKPAGKIKVLIVDGQNNHDWRATTPWMKKVLKDSGRFTVDVSTAPTPPQEPRKPKGNSEEDRARYVDALDRFKKLQVVYREAMARFHPDFAGYDVVLSNYNGDTWPKKVQEELEDYVKSGKGSLVIVHAANNSFGGWKEYNRMIGMGWRDNRFGDRLIVDAKGKQVRVPRGKGPGAGHGAQHAFLIVVRDPDHPITRGMPQEWLHTQDELYQGMRGPVENVHLLATAYADKKKGGPSSSNENEPMIWTVKYGKGRVFHTPMGHDLTGMRCVGFVTTLLRGTEWAATGKVTIPILDNFPTAKKTSSLAAK